MRSGPIRGAGLNRKPEFKDRIVSVKYNAVIDDKKTGQRSLFLPVFVEIRDDKGVADTI